MKRIALFVLTNLAVLFVLFTVLRILGVNSYLIQTQTGIGIDYRALFIFCAIFGMGGAFVSLLIAKWMAKTFMRVQLIERGEIYDMVRELADEAGIGMPEVGIFPAQQPNAFATGWNRNAALVAVSEGMVSQFQKREIRAVLAHEIGHIANGDMVTLALIQGVLNVFVMFAARVVGLVIDRVVFRREGIGLGYFLTVFVCEIFFAILASIIVFWFSRRREYSADAYAARRTSKGDMIAALQRLRSIYDQPSELHDSLLAFGIKGGRARFGGLFASHPPLGKRIHALESL